MRGRRREGREERKSVREEKERWRWVQVFRKEGG